MEIRKQLHKLRIGFLGFWLFPTYGPAAVVFTNLLSFNGSNGANPAGGLVQGPEGNFYGSTTAGGTNGYGTVFRVATNGLLTTVFSFASSNGAAPFGRLAFGNDGLLYGTTSGGGSNGNGTVFKMTTNGGLTVLASFYETNGAQPRAGLVLGNDGDFYGTTGFGGKNGNGTAFRIGTQGMLSSLASFDTNGATPYCELVPDSNGALYGTTFQGGASASGTIFKLLTNGAPQYLHTFSGGNDGGNPYAGLVRATDGTMYGTAFYGGSNGLGAVFKLTPSGLFSPLLSFNGTNGAYPQGSLVQAVDSKLYGTTQNGGAYTNQFGTGFGTVFQVTTNGTLTTLVSFAGTNGAFPRAGLAQGADGSLYGTTTYGGTNDSGTIFRIAVTSPPNPSLFQSVAQAGNTLVLTWTATLGQRYQVQFKTDLEQSNWNLLGPVINATNTLMTTTDTNGPDQARFYRLMVSP